MKKTMFLYILSGVLLLIVTIFFLYFDLWYRLIKWGQAYEWIYPILINTISGIVGGFVVYLYVMWIERRKEHRAIERQLEQDENEKKEKYTTALLSTQMAIILQMCTIYGLDKFIDERLNISVKGKSFSEHLKNTKTIQDKVNVLRLMMQEDQEVFTQKVGELIELPIIEPLANNTISFPYEILGIRTIAFSDRKKINDLADYFQKMGLCNRKYNYLLSIIQLCIDTKNKTLMSLDQKNFLNQREQEKTMERSIEYQYLAMVGGITNWYGLFKEQIKKYEVLSESILSETESYINSLGISKPIHVERDENGRVIMTDRS